MSLCSPDPQAFRLEEEAANVLHVGLPTNFKASTFADEAHNRACLQLLELAKRNTSAVTGHMDNGLVQ